MLTLTENAAMAVKGIIARSPEIDEGGLRIFSADDPRGGYTLALAGSPEPEDDVVETSGARVFLDATTSVALEDRILDAQVDDQGGVRFELGEQS